MTPRRALILPVVLLLIGLLALIMAGFVFFVRAEHAGISAYSEMQQARLAAESGLEAIVSVLRAEPHNAAAWFDVPARFRHGLVWAETYDRQSDPVRRLGSRKEYFDSQPLRVPAWRYTAAAPRYDGPQNTMRFGVTPESGKLNINTAAEQQVGDLFTPLLLGLGLENPQELIAAFLDWRDADDDVREGGAELEYYNTLEPPYNPKNGPLDSVEELLLVRGFTAAVLYGEDVNRNGILDANEDDGQASEPYYDNGDGVLNYGLAPFLTIWSRELDTALDNQPRINLNADAGVVGLQIAQYFENGELSQATIDFLLGLKAQNFNFSQISSPAALYASGEQSARGGTSPFGGAKSGSAKQNALQQDRTQRGGSQSGGALSGGSRQGADRRGGSRGGPPREGLAPVTPEGTEQTEDKGAEQPGGEQPAGEDASAGAAEDQLPPELAASPITLEEMPFIMDRFSVRPPQAAQQPLFGLINVNTAPLRVLQLIPGMTPEAAGAIVDTRQRAEAAVLRTTAWPLVTGAVDAATFRRIAPHITTKAHQVQVEVLGYADHLSLSTRLEWVIEMVGPLAQVKYHRDLTRLGPAWPIDDQTVVVANR